MTAEVAIVNKSAVAIASDSAVTIELIDSSGKLNDKIYNTANKLFALSKYAPVGIMVYNAMELGGIPWETIIKEYRKQLADTKFDHLEQYANDFFSYLYGNEILFPEAQIKAVIKNIVWKYFAGMRKGISNNQAEEVFDKKIEELEINEFAESFDERDTRLPQEYLSVVDEVANMVFEPQIIKNLKAKYRRLAALALTKKCQLQGFSGVVIAGFGEKDIFPTLVEYKTDLVILGKIRKEKLQEYTPSQSDAGKVLPFAQKDITRTILEGINPSYNYEIQKSAIELMASLSQKIIELIGELTPEQKERYKTQALDTSIKSIREFLFLMDRIRKEKHTFQIENAIQMMPFSELAEIAELFIKLTQTRRRLSPDSETVGGPIDVAVISKADGFVWVKRKFYFDKELNYSFIGNYLEKG